MALFWLNIDYNLSASPAVSLGDPAEKNRLPLPQGVHPSYLTKKVKGWGE